MIYQYYSAYIKFWNTKLVYGDRNEKSGYLGLGDRAGGLTAIDIEDRGAC